MNREEVRNFLSGAGGSLAINSMEHDLPGWLTGVLNNHGVSCLMIEGSMAVFEKLPGFSCTVPDSGNELALLYECPLENTIDELLGLDTNDGFHFPQQLRWAEDGLDQLGFCRIAVYSAERGNWAEGFVIRYNRPLTIIPEILILNEVYLQEMESYSAMAIELCGTFRIGGSTTLTGCLELSFGSLAVVTISSGQGTFPGMMDFFNWIARGMNLEKTFGWLIEDKEYFDVALKSASITIDTGEMSLADFCVEVQIKIWKLNFALSFYWSTKTLIGRKADGETLTAGRLLEAATGSSAGEETSMYINGQFLIGTENSITVSAKYQGPEGGWALRGEVQVHDGVSLQSLLEVLEQQSGGASLPSFLSIAQLEYFSFDYSQKKNQCSISFQGKLCLSEELSLAGVPMLSRMLPENITYKENNIEFIYDRGA